MEGQVQAPRSAKRNSRKLSLIIGAVLVVVLASVGFWYFQVKVPHDKAVAAFNESIADYNDAVGDLVIRTDELDSAIADLQGVIDSEAQPLDPDLLMSAGASIGEAQGSRDGVPSAPEMPKSTADIEKATKEIPARTADVEDLGDYSAVIAKLGESKAALEASIKQMEQVTNPTEKFVIERVTGLSTISGVQAVTEDHDPNGNLNKQGGYTAAVYLASTLVDSASVHGDDIVDKGTDAGGAVEVYRTAEEAEARNTYLGAFDGGVFSSGSHSVVGTVVIRTSNELTASQQTELEGAIRDALTKLV